MAELKSHNEQSMEEILAAIKHIMAEEGGAHAEPPVASPAAPAPEPPAADRRPSPESSREPSDSVHAAPRDMEAPPAAAPSPRLPPVQDAILDLTERLDEDGPVARPAVAAVTATPAPSPAPAMAAGRLNRPPPLKSGATPGEGARHIVSDATLAASVATLSQVAAIAAAGRQHELPLGDAGRTLEEMVRELLRPHLKEWLDAHLTKLVERLVRDEISRLVREAQER